MQHPQDEYRTQTDTLKDHTIHILMGGDHVGDQYRPLGRWMMVRFPEHRLPRDPPNAMTTFTVHMCQWSEHHRMYGNLDRWSQSKGKDSMILIAY